MRLEKKHSISRPSGVVAHVAKEISDAMKEIRVQKRKVSDAHVHEARRAIKRARAGLRLIRSEIAPAAYKQENKALGDVGRMLSGARDAAVIPETVKKLLELCRTRNEAQAVMKLGAALEKDRVTRDVDAKTASRVRARLKASRMRVLKWRLKKGDHQTLKQAVKASQERMRARMNDAMEERSDEALHTWRKRAQDFRFQLEMLKEILPKSGLALSKRVHSLTSILGVDHDFAVLDERARAGKLVGFSAGSRAVVRGVIVRERRKLWERAKKLGKRA